MWRAEQGTFCSFKAALFVLALLRHISKQGHPFDRASLAFLLAFKCLTAPFAWGKTLSAAVRHHWNSDATASQYLNFEALLRYCLTSEERKVILSHDKGVSLLFLAFLIKASKIEIFRKTHGNCDQTALVYALGLSICNISFILGSSLHYEHMH